MVELVELHIPEKHIAIARIAVLGELKHRGLYSPDLVYRGFGRHSLEQVLQFGAEDQNSYFIYGNDEGALLIDPDPDWENPLSYALYGGALAVYNGNHLVWGDYTCYRFKDLSLKKAALNVVFSLKD